MPPEKAKKHADFASDLMDAATEVLSLTESPLAVLEQIDGTRVEIQAVYKGVSVHAKSADGKELTARRVHGSLTFNSQYGFYLEVRDLVRAEAKRLALSSSEATEEQLDEEPEEENASGAFVPAGLAKLRALISNFL